MMFKGVMKGGGRWWGLNNYDELLHDEALAPDSRGVGGRGGWEC